MVQTHHTLRHHCVLESCNFSSNRTVTTLVRPSRLEVILRLLLPTVNMIIPEFIWNSEALKTLMCALRAVLCATSRTQHGTQYTA